MAWLVLIIAGILEIVWAISLKYSHGFSNLVPSVITIVTMILSFYFLASAVKTLPIGTAYAVWTGIGVVGTVVLGILFFNEQLTITRIVFITMILAGIIGLKVSA